MDYQMHVQPGSHPQKQFQAMSTTQDYSHLLGKLQSHRGNMCSMKDLMWTNAGESLLNLCVLQPVSTSTPELENLYSKEWQIMWHS